MEFMPGAPLEAAVFERFDHDVKRGILEQIARVFKLIQQCELPASVKGYGGLRFAKDGSIVVGPTPIHGATGPCETYYDLYSECVDSLNGPLILSGETAYIGYTGISRRSLPSWTSVTLSAAGRIQTCGRELMSLWPGASSPC